MSGHDNGHGQSHEHGHEGENHTVYMKVGIFFICVFIAICLIAQ